MADPATPSEWVRFWSFVNRQGPIPPDRPDLGPCWLWTAATTTDGFGVFTCRRGGALVQQVAHRWLFEQANGPLPAGMEPQQACGVPACVRHLQAVEGASLPDDPFGDLASAGGPLPGEGSWASRTHCPNGHPYDQANTYRPPNDPNHRMCRTCRVERALAQQQRRAALHAAGVAVDTAKTHCPAGHAYTKRNTYVDKTGRRRCCACDRERQRRRRARARAEGRRVS